VTEFLKTLEILFAYFSKTLHATVFLLPGLLTVKHLLANSLPVYATGT
jgi:hypothetical protein